MNDSLPLVSILIDNYNYGRFIRDAIDSALAQTYRPIEIIVVDDGSTDNSRAIIAGYQDKVRAIFQPNGGQAAAFNAGFAASRGQIICFLDADDWFEPDKAQSIVDALEANRRLGWCYHSLRMVETGSGNTLSPTPSGQSKVIDFRAAFRRGVAPPFAPATSGMALRRQTLEQILPMPLAIRITSDNYVKWAALGLAPGCLIERDLATLRIHGDNAYSARTDRLSLRAFIQVETAYWLRQRFPQFNRFADKLMGIGLGSYRRLNETPSSQRRVIDRHLAQTSLPRRAEILFRCWYHSNGWVGPWAKQLRAARPIG